MKNRILKAVRWLLAGLLCGALTIISFQIEYKASRHYSFTVGCGMLTVLCLLAVAWSLAGRMNTLPGTIIVEDIFKMNSGGCVVTGTVQGGFYVGEKVRITDRMGRTVCTKIYDIEIRKQKAKSAVDTPAALYLKKVHPDSIQKGCIIRNA